ncbi:hypothetical protein OK414_29825, partial [Priestia sp. JV24]|nr:hypothetical protein [Priestia megaterium]MCW1049238.1 hypothetical protein [Priestia sp. JV24]
MGLIKGKHRLGLNANGTYGDTCGFFCTNEPALYLFSFTMAYFNPYYGMRAKTEKANRVVMFQSIGEVYAHEVTEDIK